MDQPHRPHALNFVIFREDDGVFSAVCLEHFIGAQGASMEEVQNRLKSAYRAELDNTRKNGEAFNGLPAAPSRYRDMWSSGDPDITRGVVFEDVEIGQLNLAA